MSIKRKAGFTLLELLIALFIFTIISVIMVSALRTVFSTQNGTEKNARRLAELQMALTVISRDFEQAIDRPITNVTGALESSFLGSQTIAAFSHAGLDNPLGQLQRSSLQRVRYQVTNGTLVREAWEALDATRQTQIQKRTLLKSVTRVEFQYLDKNNQFQNQWPANLQGNLSDSPRAVRIKLTLEDLGKITQLYVIPGQHDQSK